MRPTVEVSGFSPVTRGPCDSGLVALIFDCNLLANWIRTSLPENEDQSTEAEQSLSLEPWARKLTPAPLHFDNPFIWLLEQDTLFMYLEKIKW